VRGAGEGLDMCRLAMSFQRAVAGQLTQQNVEHRREEDAEQGDADHAREHGHAHGMTHL
jgi:hypothetical protein